LFGLRCDYRCP